MTNKFPEATRSELLSLGPRFITKTWESTAFHLSQACEWVKKLGATGKTQPPHGTIVSIATTLMCFLGSLENVQFSAALRRWYFCTTLAANPSPANNYKIGNYFLRFCGLLERGEPIQYPRVFFETRDLVDIKHVTDSRYKAIQALMRTTVKEDLLTGNSLEGDLEDHHIFPYSLTKSGISKAKLNSIVNKIIVSKSTNRAIGNTNPDKYLVDLANLHIQRGFYGDDGICLMISRDTLSFLARVRSFQTAS